MIGKTMGHYQITGQLGKGGMGVVSQTNDHKLGRDVAIKVLQEELAHNSERIARFQREAKLFASLNHHNIAAIHELEEFSAPELRHQRIPQNKNVAVSRSRPETLHFSRRRVK